MNEKIAEMDYASDYNVATIWTKLNEVIRRVNKLKSVDNEEPIFETLNQGNVLIISKSDEGVLVASNRCGSVELKRVKYPKEEEEK